MTILSEEAKEIGRPDREEEYLCPELSLRVRRVQLDVV